MQRACGVTIALLALVFGSGCPNLGLLDDGSSVSWGPSNGGKLLGAARLPRRGQGFHMPPQWSLRGNHFGTDEMIRLIVWTGRALDGAERGLSVGVADLSPPGGGPSAWHRSHQTGRDADLLFFATDLRGRRVPLTEMVRFAETGEAILGDGRQVKFDVRRNWLLVRSLLENPVTRVQFLFISEPLKQMLLDHAAAIGEPDSLLEHAGWIMQQPSGALPHDDHLHLRIYCAPDDVRIGCRDRGVLRFQERDRKYFEPPRTLAAPLSQVDQAIGRVPAMLSLSSIPFRGFVPR